MSKPITITSDQTGGDDAGRIPTIELNPDGNNGDKRETLGDGESATIIHGFEAEEPTTARIEPPVTGKRKGGRPKGWRKASTSGIGADSAKTPDSLIDLTTLLYSIHAMGAAIIGIEELKLEESEADSMADAIKTLSKHYPTHINPKTLAWLNFGAVMIGIYGTRLEAYRMRMKKEAQTKPKVVTIPKTAGQNGSPRVPTEPQPTQEITTPSQIWYEPPMEGQAE